MTWVPVADVAKRIVGGLRPKRGPLVKTVHRLMELALAIEELERRGLMIPLSVMDEARGLAITADMLLGKDKMPGTPIHPDPIDKCSACGGTKFLRTSMWHHPHLICEPCFMIWYSEGETDAEKIGEISKTRKAAGGWPWEGKYLEAVG